MDNLNVHMYKDNDDIILVFKNAPQIQDLLASLIMTATGKEVSATKVPALDPLKEETPAIPSVDETKDILPDFLSNPSESEANDKEEIVEEIAVTKSVVSDTSVDNNTASTPAVIGEYSNEVFSNGKFAGLTPMQILEKNGLVGFFQLLALINKKTFRTEELKNASQNTVKEYYQSNPSLNSDIRELDEQQLIQILTLIYPITSGAMKKDFGVSSLDELLEYCSKRSKFNLVGDIWKVLPIIKSFINKI